MEVSSISRTRVCKLNCMLKVLPPMEFQGTPKGPPGPEVVIYLKVPPCTGVLAVEAAAEETAAGLDVAGVDLMAAGGDGVVDGWEQPVRTKKTRIKIVNRNNAFLIAFP
jgi:hypothetical protein